MSVKSKKGSRTSNSTAKEVGKGRPWPDLPQQLVYQIGRQSTLMQSITAFGGITKSWMATPRKCNPTRKPQWPQLSNGEERHGKLHQRHEFCIAFHEGDYWPWYRGISPQRCPYNWDYFVGCSHGTVVLAKGIKAQEYYVWAPETRYLPFTLPSWDKSVPFMLVTLSCRCVDHRNYVVMVLTGITSPAFLFCRSSWGKGGEVEWVRQDNAMVDPYGSNQSIMQFSNAIGFEGKFYTLSLQGALVVIEDLNDSQLTITALSKSRAVPSVPCKHFREFLVESCGEILLVFLICTKTYKVVDHVEVFKLNVAKLSWVKMSGLGDDRSLFAGANCFMSVNASKVGCRKNCIYFNQLSGEGWWVYDMETNCIIPGLGNADLAWDDAQC